MFEFKKLVDFEILAYRLQKTHINICSPRPEG